VPNDKDPHISRSERSRSRGQLWTANNRSSICVRHFRC
jgi:hypothetical protein